MNYHEIDKKNLLHPYTALKVHAEKGPHIIQRGKGIHVYDSDGKEYIDGMAGLWCMNIGYGRPEIAEAIAKQVEKLSYFHSFMSMSNEPAIKLAEKLSRLVPGKLNRAFSCNS